MNVDNALACAVGELGTLRALRELCIKFELLWWGKCRDLTSGKARGDWEQVVSCFRSIDEKFAGENERVCVKIHRSFFSVHEIEHLSTISMNRTVE